MQFDITKFALSREDIMYEAIHRCKKEMYAKAQPSVDYDKLLEQYKNGCKEKLYERYYLSHEEIKYIVSKYIELYHFESKLSDHFDLLISNMTDGTIKDKWIPGKTDDDGYEHPGYRGYENVPPLEKIIGKENAQTVIDYINDRKDFYSRDFEKEKFECAVYLGDSPTSDEKTVKKYWQSKGIDIQIDPRKYNHDYFWSEENGYLEEDEL